MTATKPVRTGCKINLGLCITERRPDGYHNLQTIFYPVPLADELVVEESDRDSLTLDGHPLDGDPQQNLVLKAVRLLREQGCRVPPVAVSLNKVIPSGAGLGGGSSDAACMVRLLNARYALGLGVEQMERLVAQLGADCPFFIRSEPVYAEGIGNEFTPVALSLRGWHLLLVKPDVHISTKEAYAGVRPHMPAHALLETASMPVETWSQRMVNDFEESIFPRHALLADIKRELYRQGAVYAAMSGSGSTLFGLFREEPALADVFAGQFTFSCRL